MFLICAFCVVVLTLLLNSLLGLALRGNISQLSTKWYLLNKRHNKTGDNHNFFHKKEIIFAANSIYCALCLFTLEICWAGVVYTGHFTVIMVHYLGYNVKC